MTDFCKIIDLPNYSDQRGTLTVLEKQLPFPVKRIFWIYGADGQVRGGHRHYKNRQALIAISGVVSIYVNNGITQKTAVLDNPNKYLLVEPEDWHTMTFGVGSVLMVISSHQYDAEDYIEAPYGLL